MFFLYIKVFMQWAWLLLLLALIGLLNGCATLSPELVRELAKDQASVCIQTDIRGGAGAIVGAPSGGYGQATGSLCRSSMPGATIELKPDGTISIKHEPAPTTMIFDPSQFNIQPMPQIIVPGQDKNQFWIGPAETTTYIFPNGTSRTLPGLGGTNDFIMAW